MLLKLSTEHCTNNAYLCESTREREHCQRSSVARDVKRRKNRENWSRPLKAMMRKERFRPQIMTRTMKPAPAAEMTWNPIYAPSELSAFNVLNSPNPMIEMTHPAQLTPRYLLTTVTIIPENSAKGAMTREVPRIRAAERKTDLSRAA